MKDIILNYITYEFIETRQHESYCYYPFEDCSCRKMENITYDTPLISGGYIDSFSMVQVLVFLEDTFSVKIKNEDAIPKNFDSINKMVELVENYKLKK